MCTALFHILSHTAAEDFASQSGVLSFTNDTEFQCASIMVIDDNSSESYQECFTLSLLGATDLIANPSVATVCIDDDDGECCAGLVNAHVILNNTPIAAHPVTIGLQQTSYTVDEVDGTLALCMEVISGDVDGRSIVINYVTSSGTATGKPYISNGGLFLQTHKTFVSKLQLEMTTLL